MRLRFQSIISLKLQLLTLISILTVLAFATYEGESVLVSSQSSEKAVITSATPDDPTISPRPIPLSERLPLIFGVEEPTVDLFSQNTPSAPCTNTSQYPSYSIPIDPTGAVATITTCNYAGEYSTVTGAVSGQALRFTTSQAGDEVTIHSGTFNGPVVASGVSPLSFPNNFTGTLFAHWNTFSCGTQSSCRTTTVQCVNCSGVAGALDSTFGSGGKVIAGGTGLSSKLLGMTVQSDGKIVTVGYNTPSQTNMTIDRFNIDGTGNTSCTVGYGNGFPSKAESVAIQSDGKIVVGGSVFNGTNWDFTTVRVLADGCTLDGFAITNIGTGDDFSTTMALQSDGKIVLGGHSVNGAARDFALVRYTSTFALDTTFNTTGMALTPVGPGDDVGNALVIDSSGRLLLGGEVNNGANYDFGVVRYNANGTLDTTFNTTGKVITAIGTGDDGCHALVLQPDGRIVAAGYSNNGANFDFGLIRYNTNGSLDTTFNSTGKVTTPIGTLNDGAYGVAIQPDGRIVAAGDSNNGSNFDFAAARYNTNGSLDTRFDGDGKLITSMSTGDDRIEAVRIQPDGRIITAGWAGSGTNSNFALARYVGFLPGIVRFSSDSYGVSENFGPAQISVTRTSGSDGSVQAQYSTFDGNAIAPQDYTSVFNILSWGDGDNSSKFINIPIIDDNIFEGTENFSLSLNLTGGNALFSGPGSVPIFIFDNESPPTLSITNVTQNEGNAGQTPFTFTVTKTGATTVNATVNFVTQDGTAFVANNDYQATSGTLTFLPGDTTKQITVLVNGDTTPEPDETFNVNLSNAGNATIAGGTATGTIVNDDGCPIVQISYRRSSSGILNANSCVVAGNKTDQYTFSGSAGDQIVIGMTSRDFDTQIALVDPSGTIISTNNITDGTFDSRLPALPATGYFTLPALPASGTYTILAFPHVATGTGAYSLSLDLAPQATCTYSFVPQTNVTSTGGTFSFYVVTQTGCPQAAMPTATGQFYTGLTYQGDRVSFTVPANGPGSRQETISFPGVTQTHTIFQFGSAAPTNDLFANAQPLTGATNPAGNPITGSNTTATGPEAGEPAHNGQTAAKSVWYSWTTPAGGAGLYTFTTSGSNFDTVMAVYSCPPSGACNVGSPLTPVGSNDNTATFDKTSKVNFLATTGTRYMIAIDGKTINQVTASGTINLSWHSFERLFRLYLKNFSGGAAPYVPTSVVASNGTVSRNGILLSLGVYDFSIPADKTEYVAQISGPSGIGPDGIQWSPSSVRLVDNIGIGNSPFADSATGQISKSYADYTAAAQSQIIGYIGNIPDTENGTAMFVGFVGEVPADLPKSPVPCSPLTTSNFAGYRKYSCPNKPSATHFLFPKLAAKSFNELIHIFTEPLPKGEAKTENTGSSYFSLSDKPSYSIVGQLPASGNEADVSLTFKPFTGKKQVTLRTTASPAFQYDGLLASSALPLPGLYTLTAEKPGFSYPEVNVTLTAPGASNINFSTTPCTYTPQQNIPPGEKVKDAPVGFILTTNDQSCEWVATRAADSQWITVAYGVSPGNAGIGLTLDANNTGATRTGSVIISGGGTQVSVPIQQLGATVTPTPTPAGFEGDVNRTALGVPGTGDGDINVGDQIAYQRFLSGIDCPSVVPNEQQRLDAGPRISFGDGSLGSSDGTAISAYARHDSTTDFDPNTLGWQPTPAGGPTAIINLGCTPPSVPVGETATAKKPKHSRAKAAAARTVTLISTSGSVNSDVFVEVELEAQGNELGIGYSLHFDPAILSISNVAGVNLNPDVTAGTDAPAGTLLNVSAEGAASGNIGINETFSTAVSAGTRRITRFKFHVLGSAPLGVSPVVFTNNPNSKVLIDTNGLLITLPPFIDGNVTVVPPSISGRITTSRGAGLRNATAILTDANSQTSVVTLSSFGFYKFYALEIGKTYTVSISSRQYVFNPRTVILSGDIANLDFVGVDR